MTYCSHCHNPARVATATRYDVDYVVTEHGVAQLRGRTTSERARGLIDIAHPTFRDDLTKTAREWALL